MAGSRTELFEALKSAAPTAADSVARLQFLAHLLDSAFLIPGINRRIGLDAVIGLLPGIGDAISTALSSYIIWEARQLGVPRWKIARMIGNVALDTAVGAIPLAGDLFDAAFKSNQRNLKIVLDHLERTGRAGPRTIEGQATRIGG